MLEEKHNRRSGHVAHGASRLFDGMATPRGEELLPDPGDKQPPRPEGQPLLENAVAVSVQEKRQWGSPALRQVLATVGPMAAITSSGMTTGFTAVLLPQLEATDCLIPVTAEEASWVASAAALSMAPGCVLGGLLMERLGRRASHQLVCVPYVLGWVIISMARNTAMLYIGRFLTGLCVGMIGPLSAVFIAEISGPAYRGVLLATVSLAVATGILLANLLGTFLHWKLAAAISAIFPLVCYVGVYWLPESPTWLAARGRHAEATVAFQWYRGCSPDAVKEMTDLLNKHAAGRPKQSWAELWVEMRKASFLKPFFVMIVFFFVMQFSGVNAVAFYTVTILDDMGSGLDAFVATNIIGLVRVVMSVVACILARRFGRRPLSVISSLGAAATLLGLGAADAGWAPVVLLVLYICFISIGLVPLPWVMVGEVFPAALRGLGSGVTTAYCFLMFFAVVKTGPDLIASIGIHGAFYTYGAVALGGAVFIYAFLPETRNRTLQDIEEAYRRTNRLVCDESVPAVVSVHNK